MSKNYTFDYNNMASIADEIIYQADLIDEEGFSNNKIKNNLVDLANNIKNIIKNYNKEA